MGLEQFSRRLAELIDIPAGGAECGQQCQSLVTHCCFDQK